MSKYFIDTEFLNGPQKTWWGGKTKPFLDLISIALVSEDGRELYLISKEFNLKEAWNRFQWERKSVNDGIAGAYKRYWIRENVLRPIFDELRARSATNDKFMKDHHFTFGGPFTYDHLKLLVREYGKTNAEIAEAVRQFCKLRVKTVPKGTGRHLLALDPYQKEGQQPVSVDFEWDYPSFYGSECSFDYVILSQLMGGFEGWPKGWPYHINDLKTIEMCLGATLIPASFHDNTNGRYEKAVPFKEHPNYPKEPKVHHPLIEARYFKKLWEFLRNI